MSEEQNKILWDKLRGVEGIWQHYFSSDGSPFCEKCACRRELKDACSCGNYKYPGSEADIAKEIRVFMAKQDWKTTSSYYNNIHVMFVNTDHDCSFASWLIFGITDEQKIEAFTNLWKKDKKCQQ